MKATLKMDTEIKQGGLNGSLFKNDSRSKSLYRDAASHGQILGGMDAHQVKLMLLPWQEVNSMRSIVTRKSCWLTLGNCSCH